MLFKEIQIKRLIKNYRKMRTSGNLANMKKVLAFLMKLNPIGFGDFVYGINTGGVGMATSNMEQYFLKGSK